MGSAIARCCVGMLLLCALVRTDAQTFGGCQCVKKQLMDNCRAICACLLAQGQPVGSQAMCEQVCLPCDAEFKKSGCPSDDKLPVVCLRPASFGAAVQKCDAVRNKQCDPPGQKSVQTEQGKPAGRKLF